MLNLIAFLTLILPIPVEDRNLLEAVPTEARLVFSANDIGNIMDLLETSPMANFLNNPELKALIDEQVAELKSSTEEQMGELSPFKLFNAVTGDVTLYSKSMKWEEKKVDLVLLVEIGEERDKFDEYLDAVKEFFYEEEEDFACSSDSYQDVDLEIFDSKDMGEENISRIVMGDSENLFFIVINTDEEEALAAAHQVIDFCSGDWEGESILENENFLSARENGNGPGNAAEGYFDLTILLENLPENLSPFLSYVNVIKHSYFTFNLEDEGCFDLAFFIGMEGEGLVRDIVNCFVGEISVQDLIKLAPAEASSVGVSYMGLGAMYNRIIEELKAQSEDDYNTFRGLYDEMVVNRFQVDPEKEILEQMDGRFASFTMELAADEVEMMKDVAIGAGAIYILGVKDSAVFKANFEKTLRAFGLYVSLKKEEFQGNKIYSIQIPATPLRINWIFSENLFVVSFFPSTIRTFLRLQSSTDQSTFADREDVKGFLKGNPDASHIVIYNIADFLVEIVNTTTKAAMNEMRGAGVADFEIPDIFTDTAKIKDYFTGTIFSASEINENGLKVLIKSR